MRVAVIADVHGNALALAAVLAAVTRAAPDLVVELGDAVSGPLWPDEALGMLEAAPGMAGPAIRLRGNHDRWVAFAGSGPESAPLHPVDAFARARIGEAGCRALGARPMSWRGEGILAMHALPEDDLVYLLHEATEAGVRERGPAEAAALLPEPAGETLVLTAHTHRARMLHLPDGRLVLNPGSVGQPAYQSGKPFPHRMEASSPHARWALAERRAKSWRVEFHAEEYDWDIASAEALRNGQAAWSHPLATGRMS